MLSAYFRNGCPDVAEIRSVIDMNYMEIRVWKFESIIKTILLILNSKRCRIIFQEAAPIVKSSINIK